MGILFLEHNKNSSAPPQGANNSSRMMIIDPNTPPIMVACMFMSLLMTFSDPIEAEVVNKCDGNVSVLIEVHLPSVT